MQRYQEKNKKRFYEGLTGTRKSLSNRKYLIFFPLVVCFLTIMVLGCAQESVNIKSVKKTPTPPSSFKPYSTILESSYAAADKLADILRQREISMDKPILSASFVNIDNLTESSTLGRIISEQISSRLAQHGFKIIEIKLRQESLFIKEGKGEFLLSRELRDISAGHDVYAVLVGTYAVSEYFVFVSARIALTKDSSVIVSSDYELPNDIITKSLLE